MLILGPFGSSACVGVGFTLRWLVVSLAHNREGQRRRPAQRHRMPVHGFELLVGVAVTLLAEVALHTAV